MNMSVNNTNTNMDNLTDLYFEYADKYNKVFIDSFGDAGVFIYRTIGRKDYKEILENEKLNSCDKEEIICEICTLYPQNYDFSKCQLGGLPTLLANRITELSLLNDVTKQINAIHYYRDKLANDLDDQINCVIHEAFPEFSIEEIANWDADKSANYMAKAEYILHNLRGVPLSPTGIDTREQTVNLNTAANQVDDNDPRRFVPSTSEIDDNHKLTPQKLAELKRKFPEIDWENDEVIHKGTKAFVGKDVDTRSRGLRVDEPIPEPALNRIKERAKEKIKKQ